MKDSMVSTVGGLGTGNTVETKECHARPLVAWNCRRKS